MTLIFHRLQIDRLQTRIQEQELTNSQQETIFKTEASDLKEQVDRLTMDINILHDRLDQSQAQVRNYS
jgi:ubiquinone biosynthesis protein UbiJ